MDDQANATAAAAAETPAAPAEPTAAAETEAAPAAPAAPVAPIDPMPKAVAHGWPEVPTLEARAKTLVAEFEHAMKNNAPMTSAMMAELKALLLGE